MSALHADANIASSRFRCADLLTDDIAAALSVHGLILRGGFNFGSGETAPAGPGPEPAKAVLLVGQAGDAPWPFFQRWLEGQPPGLLNPLDAWSREVIGAVALEVGARAVSPSDRPWLPFQQWAMRAEGLRPSPLGVLMHPFYGPWHAYRGALLFERELPWVETKIPIHLCDRCAEKPCLNACPIGAHRAHLFAYDKCLAHVRSPAGEVCRSGGCLDRHACPEGAAYRYGAAAQAFHMAAFAKA